MEPSVKGHLRSLLCRWSTARGRLQPSEGAGGPVGPSGACQEFLREVQAAHVGSVPFEICWSLPIKRLPPADHASFRRALAALGYTITGFATKPDDQDTPVAPAIAALGTPVRLTRLRGTPDELRHASPEPREGRFPDPLRRGLRFSLPMEAEDEVWEFWSSPATWRRLMGAAVSHWCREA